MRRRLAIALFLAGLAVAGRWAYLSVQLARQASLVERAPGLVLASWPPGQVRVGNTETLAIPVFLSQTQLQNELNVVFPGREAVTIPPLVKDRRVASAEKPLVLELFARPLDSFLRSWGWLLGALLLCGGVPLWRHVSGPESGVMPEEPEPDEVESLQEGGRVGQYRLARRLGQGATGTVWEARGQDGKVVAIKVLDPALLAQDEFQRRFEREFAIAHRFSHPRLVTFHTMGRVKDTQYVTMDLLRGGSLRDLMTGPVPASQALAYARQIADGLAHAHAQGVIHRDLKPENVLLRGDGGLAITDFGMARALDSSTITVAGTIMGTPAYLSPDAMNGKKPAPSSDIYSFGVLLFELFSGHLPFTEPDPMRMLLAHLSNTPPELGAEHPQPLRELVARMLSKDPDLRPTSDEVAERLRKLDG